MNNNQRTEANISSEKILEELKKLRGESLIKDVLLAIVPLLVAGISIYFSNQSTEKQLEFSNTQLTQTREIENAKLLEGFSQRILNGGKEAELARIALDSVRLTKAQKEQLSGFFEAAAGGSDSPTDQTPTPPPDSTQADQEFEKLLTQLFSSKRDTRANAYSATKTYLLSHDTDGLIDQMIAKVRYDPYNIKGRSNVLAILDSLPIEKLANRKDALLSFFVEIENNGQGNPAYAVGPQTTGWIKELRQKLS